MIGLGEEPVFFAHAAARFAGEPGMPNRFLSFHNGHASLFEYYHGPERKVYTDPRLEVAGADLFERYIDARASACRRTTPAGPSSSTSWAARSSWSITSTTGKSAPRSFAALTGVASGLTRSWRSSCTTRARRRSHAHAVDFAARHFRPDPDVGIAHHRRADGVGKGVSELCAGRRSPRCGAGRAIFLARHSTTPGACCGKFLTRPPPGSSWVRSSCSASSVRRPARGFAPRLIRFSTCRSSVRLTHCDAPSSWHRTTFRRCSRYKWLMTFASCTRPPSRS